MLVLVSYDVNTQTSEGRARLRKVAKICVNHGQRVQNSVFECLVDPVQLHTMKEQLLKVMDPTLDSIRFYNLGRKHHEKVEHHGAKPSLALDGVLIL